MSPWNQGPGAAWPGVLGEPGLAWHWCSPFAFTGSQSVEGPWVLPVCGGTFPAGDREGRRVCCQARVPWGEAGLGAVAVSWRVADGHRARAQP